MMNLQPQRHKSHLNLSKRQWPQRFASPTSTQRSVCNGVQNDLIWNPFEWQSNLEMFKTRWGWQRRVTHVPRIKREMSIRRGQHLKVSEAREDNCVFKGFRLNSLFVFQPYCTPPHMWLNEEGRLRVMIVRREVRRERERERERWA